MIPRQLILSNFLSYRDASLDFQGLHVACIAGPNGAGKSSLLEAMAWAIWGQSRVAIDDDIIYQGELEARVTFQFEQGGQGYRILRSRHRRQGTCLEFQLETKTGYRVLTQRGLRATQQLICQHLKLDYDTFVNSAYLRQGRVDEFMLKRPSDRKQILVDLLQLNQYERLADQAREKARELKALLVVRQTQLQDWDTQIQQRNKAEQTYRELQVQLQQLEQTQQQGQQRLQQLNQQHQQHQQYQQEKVLLQQQADHLQQLTTQLGTEITEIQQQQQQLDQILEQAGAIEAGLTALQQLQRESASLADQFRQFQALQHTRQQLEYQLRGQQQAVQSELELQQAKLHSLEAQLTEIQPLLARQVEVATACDQLRAARKRLKQLDNLQLQVAPLLQRRQHLQTELDRVKTRLQTQLEELTATEQQITHQQAQHPQLMASATAVGQALSHLEQRRAYQLQVQEKGLERRSFMERLQANQRLAEMQLTQVDQKLQLLSQPDASCPLCDQPLEQHRRELVTERHRLEQQEWREQLWVIREQLAVSEREIQVLRQEYRDLEVELEQYATVLRQRGQVEAQMVAFSQTQSQLQQLESEKRQLEHCLQDNTYAIDLQVERHQIDQTLAQLQYDDRDHALARGQVDRLRWADLKRAEIRQAQRRQQRLLAGRPDLEAAIITLEQQLQDLSHSPLAIEIEATQSQIQGLGYCPDQHQRLRDQIQQHQQWLGHQRDLERAQATHPLLTQRRSSLEAELAQQQRQQQQVIAQIADLDHRLQQIPFDPAECAIQAQQLQANSQKRDQLLAQLGATQQQLQQLERLEQQQQQVQRQVLGIQQQYRVYQELAQAFGRNGIQAMVIETLLPQLEAETNRLLNRLSDHQLHVQFVTQRASRSQQGKLIDTLDILIADLRGTRPYETYSGGEAFRVNFAIRLALARLLAQRSGVPLQMLIIDEGFGTQDQEGCNRLIAAINAIAVDFSCILAVTHIPHFREAFQTRIDVTKGYNGSCLTLSS